MSAEAVLLTDESGEEVRARFVSYYARLPDGTFFMDGDAPKLVPAGGAPDAGSAWVRGLGLFRLAVYEECGEEEG